MNAQWLADIPSYINTINSYLYILYIKLVWKYEHNKPEEAFLYSEKNTTPKIVSISAEGPET
jgi:hypothetical protein